MAYATTNALAAETSARKAGDTSEINARTNADTSEAKIRADADAALDARIKTVETWIAGHPDTPIQPPVTPPVQPPVTPPVSTGIYGTGLSGDSRANQQIGAALSARLAYRFRATHTGQATSLRVQERGGAVYSGGTGGAIKATIQTDSSGLPSGAILASVTWVPGNTVGNWEVWPQHTFASPANLATGTLYHLVFENTDAAQTANWISLNMLFTMGSLPSPRQAAFSDDFATLYAQPTTWKLQPQHTPIFDLAYADGSHDGQVYIGTLWDKYGTISGGANMVRERFTVTNGDRTVGRAHVRVKRLSGSGPLMVRLEKGDGTLIEAVAVPASSVAIGQVPDGSASSLAGDTWAHATFAAPHVLANGQAYALRLDTDTATTYTAVPIQQGTSKGLASRVFGDGDGQRTTDGGTTWTNLYPYDSVDLQFWLD